MDALAGVGTDYACARDNRNLGNGCDGGADVFLERLVGGWGMAYGARNIPTSGGRFIGCDILTKDAAIVNRNWKDEVTHSEL